MGVSWRSNGEIRSKAWFDAVGFGTGVGRGSVLASACEDGDGIGAQLAYGSFVGVLGVVPEREPRSRLNNMKGERDRGVVGSRDTREVIADGAELQDSNGIGRFAAESCITGLLLLNTMTMLIYHVHSCIPRQFIMLCSFFSRSGGSPITEVEPYIPFNINPSGMQPVLTTTYLLAFPSIIASIFNSSFWEYLKEILNPASSIGARPWVFYAIYAFFVFLFNIFDIANLPKEISDYMTKMGARIPNIKPGKATVEYLTKIQASTRFWGGVLLSILATSSSVLDHNLRQMNENFSVGFTSVLIIVGSIIELRRSYQAYNVMPTLSKVLRRYGV